MKFLYFLVNWDTGKSKELHEYFFIYGNGFVMGIVLAVVAALAFALFFYFVLGRNVRTSNLTNWLICGVVAMFVTFGVSDLVFIGREPTKKEKSNNKKLDRKITYMYSFYRSLERATGAPSIGGGNKLSEQKSLKKRDSQRENESYDKAKRKIVEDLNKGKDVRYPYSINTTIWCAVFFLLFSLLFKGVSVAAKTTPITWPYNS